MPGPIRPEEVYSRKLTTFPEEVFEAFNELITRRFDGDSSKVDQSEVADLIAKKLGIQRSLVFSRGYLNVEEVYGAFGWVVEYDKPGYNETYPATFTFRRKQS